MRHALTGFALLFIFSSFHSVTTPAPVTPPVEKRIIYSGCFDAGGIIITVDYNPGLGQIADIYVSGPGGSYYVVSHSDDSSIYNVGSTLYATGSFYVYYSISGYPGTYLATWGGELSDSCD